MARPSKLKAFSFNFGILMVLRFTDVLVSMLVVHVAIQAAIGGLDRLGSSFVFQVVSRSWSRCALAAGQELLLPCTPTLSHFPMPPHWQSFHRTRSRRLEGAEPTPTPAPAATLALSASGSLAACEVPRRHCATEVDDASGSTCGTAEASNAVVVVNGVTSSSLTWV
jgi:hypothetical protein